MRGERGIERLRAAVTSGEQVLDQRMVLALQAGRDAIESWDRYVGARDDLCAYCDGDGEVVHPENADPTRPLRDLLPPVSCPRCGGDGREKQGVEEPRVSRDPVSQGEAFDRLAKAIHHEDTPWRAEGVIQTKFAIRNVERGAIEATFTRVLSMGMETFHSDLGVYWIARDGETRRIR